MEKPADLPARFEIKIGKETRWRQAQIRWRTVSEVGIAFV